MKLPRAVIFDIYGTLLAITETPRSDAEWRLAFGRSRDGFRADIAEAIAHEQARARRQGIAHPEVQWPEIIARVHPTADPEVVARFERVTRAAPGAIELLAWLGERSIPLGLVSNAQAYTLNELRECGIFPEAFSHRFLSFERGFSKPDPTVFQWVGERFAPLTPADILIVGDREDNDIRPARALGFLTWWVRTEAGQGLNELQNWLKSLEL